MFTDLFHVGRWKDRPLLNDDRLIKLADCLPSLVLSSKSDNTVRKYKSGFNQWLKWCKSFQRISPLPADEFYLALFLTSLIQSECHFSKIEEIVYSLSWCHHIAGFEDPCQSFLIQSLRLSAKRILSRPVNKKEPITTEILHLIVDKFAPVNASLIQLRLATMCLIGFAGFMRFSELVNIKRSDITIEEQFVSIFIRRSKTDKFQAGANVVIAATNSKCCPVSMLKRYLTQAQLIDSQEELYIFSQMSFCKNDNSYKFRPNNAKLSYTRAREILLDALDSVGLDKKKFGLHSLRSGGASSAAAAGVSDRLFKKHGRWRSDQAKDGYVKESESVLLSVTKNLGL